MRAMLVVIVIGFVLNLSAWWSESWRAGFGELVPDDVAAMQRGGESTFQCAKIVPFTCDNVPDSHCIAQSVYGVDPSIGEPWASQNNCQIYCGITTTNCLEYSNVATTKCGGT
jgi:hypothetical protein